VLGDQRKLDRTHSADRCLETPIETAGVQATLRRYVELWTATDGRIYVPIIRNQPCTTCFYFSDYNDASVLTGNRNTSTLSPQALFLHEFGSGCRLYNVDGSRAAVEGRVLSSDTHRKSLLKNLRAMPTDIETRRIADFLDSVEKTVIR